MTEDTEKALEYAYEWLFSEKDRTYVRYINELYEITYDFIREKSSDLSRLKDDLNVVLDQFELEYRSILGES